MEGERYQMDARWVSGDDVQAAPRRGALRTRDEFLSAAMVCVSERGFDRTRLRDVAKEAGTSIGLLQYYFDSRDALLTEAFRWTCEGLIKRWRRRAGTLSGEPWDKVTVLIEELTGDPAMSRHAATWIEFCASAARHPQLRGAVTDVFAAWREIFANAVEEGIRLGVFEPLFPPMDVADMLNAVVDGFEMAVAVDAGLVSANRVRHLVLAAAATLLRPVGET